MSRDGCYLFPLVWDWGIGVTVGLAVGDSQTEQALGGLAGAAVPLVVVFTFIRNRYGLSPH